MKKFKLFLNPGHCPGVDPGAVGNGVQEAEVVREISAWVALYLRKAGLEVEVCQQDNLDRGEDSVVGKANASGADLFLSIHANSFVDPRAKGTESYCFERGGEGERLAASIHWQIVHSIKGIVDRGVKTANYAVLRGTVMPAVLVEVAFVSSPEDAALLKDQPTKVQFARAISRGVTDYITYA